jgi:hypothetical protein
MMLIFSILGWLVGLGLAAYLFKIKSEVGFARKQAESLSKDLDQLKELSSKQNLELIHLKEKNAGLVATNESIALSKAEALETLRQKTADLEMKMDLLRNEKDQFAKKIVSFEQNEAQRIAKHSEQIHRLDVVYKQREDEREKEKLAKEKADFDRLQALKETWGRHELSIEEKIRAICQKHDIEYVDKTAFPHKGTPDNSVKICGEFIIFDSKSPQGDDFGNFPTYIKREAEAAKKYAKYDDVKKDIFLVVPTNAIHVIDDKYKVNGDYRVHVITEDALEPILLSLQKIEEYEFADKLSPEGREKIVSVLGKMAHGMKRRIQVDHFFANEFISVLTDAENLPADILTDAQDVERSSKLNPPLERRTKIIDSKSLVKRANKLAGKAKGQEIDMDANLSSIDNVPLYTNEKSLEPEAD